MLTYFLIAVAVIVLLLVVFVAMQPSAFAIARSATVAAPAPVVFELVNDFHHWHEWSPWAKRDPNMSQTFAGAPAGEGAVYSWSGNREVGEGRMTIVESRPPARVLIKLEFLKPFAATNLAEFTFEPRGGQTLVTWGMTGHKNFVMKAFTLLINMDKAIGGDFEKGLADMKAAAEGAAVAA